MRKSKFTESQIMAILKQNEAEVPVPVYWSSPSGHV